MDEQANSHSHQHGGNGGGHTNDQGARAMFRYIKLLPSMWNSKVNAAVLELLAPQPGERILDIGAGMGAGAIPAAHSGASVVAVEPTPFLRRVLIGRRFFQRNRKQITVVDGSAERLTVADESIDAVWAVNTMHHWVDAERGIAEIARALRPGGRVILVDEVFSDPRHPDHERFTKRHEADSNHGFNQADADEMTGLLVAAGLTRVETEERDLAGAPVLMVTAEVGESTAVPESTN
ncbi:class I SAM-dependent methyltransferase [Acidimicrobiaceae bacterium AH-315-P05]|nr:class I SAM-dependent methyltransferase [Acidimicrobiaceae bacterium AH-315-P05]